MKKNTSSQINRRHFLAKSAAAMVLPLILPGCATGPGKRPRPSNRINLGVVGWGMQGPGNTNSFLVEPDCQVIAACDLAQDHLTEAVDTINGHYQNKDCKAYHDYREMMARDDLDAVMLAVPDHWHELVATEAAGRGLDIYGEKPLAKTIAEQQAIVRAVEKNKIIWQTGSWQRSQANFHKAAEVVRNGLIGEVTQVEVGLPAGHNDFAGTAPELLQKLAALNIHNLAEVRPGTEAWKIAVSEPPAGLDYNMWIGPSKMEPYIKQRINKDWRWNYNTGGGQLLDWVGHHVDIAHWGMDCDRSGPSEIEGHGEFPARDALWNTCTKYRIELKYPRNITMTIAGGYDDIRGGTKWIGTEGWVWVDRDGRFEASNPEWKKGKSLPEELRKVKLYESRGHQRNFLDCVKSRQPTITPVETAHHSAIPGHLGLISMLVGRKIHWNAASEKIIGDPEASKLLTREYRPPWKMS
ncbi:MAG TPA: Gfo/Idh/MocA family oxidoreductase [Verrucomicrobiae bacterium]|nr:Gfo/Idh/MocA family oxidoreductase [Verrucomicrobiae bacterium]